MTPRLVMPLLLLALAGCERSSKAPWLTYPGTAAHVFRLVGTPHDPTAPGTEVTCQACHPSTTFAVFVCTTCHDPAKTDPFHTAVGGYAAGSVTSADCYRCHPNGLGVAPESHPSLFPIDSASKHAAVGCSQCHTDLASPRVATNFQCGTCHLALDPSLGTRHTVSTSDPAVVVLDYAQSSDACLRCHADSQVSLTASHPTIDGSRALPHKDATCTQCHDTYRTDKPFGADFAKNPASWAVGSGHGCYVAGCHTSVAGGGN